METVFDRVTAVSRLPDPGPSRAAFAIDISPDWRAGRGPHGGYLAAIVLRALTEALADEGRSPRSLTIHYASAPASGPASIEVAVERQGSSLSTLSARLEQDGECKALALAAFSVPWSGPEIDRLAMPKLAPPDPERRFTAGYLEGAASFAPSFTRQLVMQQRMGGIPFEGVDVPMEVGGWLGLPEPRPLDAPAVAMFCDAWFPPAFLALDQFIPCPTIDLTIHFRHPIEPARRDPEELCLGLFSTRLVHQGFFEEDGIVWDASGAALAQSRQLALLTPLRAG